MTSFWLVFSKMEVSSMILVACALPAFWRPLLALLAASRLISNSVMVTLIFFLIFSTSTLSRFSVSINLLVRDSISAISFCLELLELVLQLPDASLCLGLGGVAVLEGPGQLLTVVGQLAVLLLRGVEPLLEGVHLGLVALVVVLKLGAVTLQRVVLHHTPVHVVA